MIPQLQQLPEQLKKTAFGSLTGGGGGFTLLGPLRLGCGGGGDGGMGFGLF